jgi:hypothetical protein
MEFNSGKPCLKVVYNEDTGEVIISKAEDIVEEETFTSTDIAPASKHFKVRRIIIGGAVRGGHHGRMKVSSPIGVGEYKLLSMHTDKNDTIVKKDGDPKNINMDTKEYKIYEGICMRNANLLRLAEDDNFVQACIYAIINDEKLRIHGYTVKRDKRGIAEVYDESGKFLYRLNLNNKRM